ncbi:MAG: MotA/TolQ/ExbB proton channel family protein [Thermodesulfobacteriota bacterium]|nr:MotA/TolQ/ExbB proton channel family protein [Thermodesulfobacteriota bacterium]
MKNKNIIGFTACLFLFLVGFFMHGNIGLYFNISGLMIVIGGTFGATLVSYRLERLKIVFDVVKASYRVPHKSPETIVQILVDLSVKSRFRGILSLQEDEEETSILFLRRALGFVVDGFRGEQIRDILKTEMYFFRLRRDDSERVLRTMADLFPAFGLMGSVVGLIGMLAGVGDTSVILTMVPVALTSTLYGVIFSNFFLTPFASNLRQRTDHELLLQKIITEGVIAIGTELNPRVLERKLKSFLTPSSRKVRLVTLERIQERFKIKKEAETEKPSASEEESPNA